MQKFFRKLHMWIGLIAGFLLVIVGLTGSSIVFYKALEETINSDILRVEAVDETKRISITSALEKVANHYPEKTVLGIMPPRHENATYLSYRFYTPKGEENPVFTFVSVHPQTGEILGELQWGKTLMTFLYSLHYTLTFGAIGALVIGFIGIFFIITMLTGLYLWYPRARKWKQALWFKKNAKAHRRNFDIHRVFGFYPMVIMLVVAFSGVYMIFPQQFKDVIEKISPLYPDIEHTTKIEVPKEQKPIVYEQVVKIAREAFPTAKISGFDRPHDKDHPYVVSFFSESYPRSSSGYDQAYIHPYNGKILAVRRWADASGGDVFLGWQFPLHNGEAFGLFGRIIIFICGFIPLVLYVTGVCMWWKRNAYSFASLKFWNRYTHYKTCISE